MHGGAEAPRLVWPGGLPPVIVVLSATGASTLTRSMLDSRARGSCPLLQSRQPVLIENKCVLMKYTICTVAPLDRAEDHGPSKCSLLPRKLTTLTCQSCPVDGYSLRYAKLPTQRA